MKKSVLTATAIGANVNFQPISGLELKEIVGKLAVCVEKNNSLPVLDMARFDSNGITTTTLEASCIVPNKSFYSGVGLLEFQTLNVISRAMKPTDKLAIMFNSETFESSVLLNGVKYGNFQGSDIAEFPLIPTKVDNYAGLLDCNMLKKYVGFASKDDLRPAMTGVYFNEGEVVATDAHCMVWGKQKTTLSETIIPAIASKLTGAYKVSYNDTNVKFENNQATYVFRKIDDKYPNHKAVIPTGGRYTLTVGKSQLIEALNKVVPHGNTTTKQVTLYISANNVTLCTQDLDFSRESTISLECDFVERALTESEIEHTKKRNESIAKQFANDGSKNAKKQLVIEAEKLAELNAELAAVKPPHLEIAFNGTFLLKCLQSTDTEIIDLVMSSPTRACIINERMLIMPAMINVN